MASSLDVLLRQREQRVAWLGEASLTQGGCDGSSARYTTAKLSEEGPPTQATTGPSTARRGTTSGRSNSGLACGRCRRCVRLRRWDQRTGVGCAERGLWRVWRGGDWPGRVGGWPAAQRARGDDGALSAERAPLRLVSGFAAAIRSDAASEKLERARRVGGVACLPLPPGGPLPLLRAASCGPLLRTTLAAAADGAKVGSCVRATGFLGRSGGCALLPPPRPRFVFDVAGEESSIKTSTRACKQTKRSHIVQHTRSSENRFCSL